eukprot:14117001-Alexandrium_andersonii.AAC.1
MSNWSRARGPLDASAVWCWTSRPEGASTGRIARIDRQTDRQTPTKRSPGQCPRKSTPTRMSESTAVR